MYEESKADDNDDGLKKRIDDQANKKGYQFAEDEK
jgi:hypothetical protein